MHRDLKAEGWLCERLEMGTPASVSQFVRRWRMHETNRLE